MKLVTFEQQNKTSCGVLTDSGIIDINMLKKGQNHDLNLKKVLENGSDFVKNIEKMIKNTPDFTPIPLSAVKLLAPIPNPGKALALAGNYTKHIIEAGLKLGLSDSPQNTTVPRPFIMPSTAIIGTDTEIPFPAYSKQIDYEIELAVVIGKKAKCVTAEQASDYIAGYTIVNDVSARSVTFAENRNPRPWDEFFDWLNGKWADGFLPMGPYLLTADEIDDVQNLSMTLKVNGETRQQANTSQMIFTVADIVSFLSNLMTLAPGDIIATGTPAGVAMATGNFLKAGDKIECSIEKLGTLKNFLGPKPEKFYEPLKR